MTRQEPNARTANTRAPIYLSSFRKEARRTQNRNIIQQYYTATALAAVLVVATAAAFLVLRPASTGNDSPATRQTAQQTIVRS